MDTEPKASNHRHRRRRIALLPLLWLAVLVVVAGLWARAQQRQYWLNRQLIAALSHKDTRQSLTLIKAGADPNTPLHPKPIPTLLELVKQCFHRSTAPVNENPTALMIACGWMLNRPDAPKLIEAMLQHGGLINAKDEDGGTPLWYAVRWGGVRTVRVLLDHRADVNTRYDHNMTVLMYSIHRPEVMRLLLQHGAKVNAQDDQGYTALYWSLKKAVYLTKIEPSFTNNYTDARDCAGQLLAYGADPNLAPKRGRTPLMIAEHYPELAILLRHHGARK